MSEDKNPFLEAEKKESEVEVVEEEKIGFNSAPKIGFDQATPVKRGAKHEEKYPDNFEGKGLRKAAKLCTVFGIIFSVLSMMYFLLPIFAAIIGGLIAVCIVMFMICSVIFTLGMILMNDGYRDWIGNHMMDVPNFFFKAGENVAKLAPFYMFAAGPALALTIAGFILGIVGKSKNYRFFVSYIIINAVFLTFVAIFTILYFGSGMNVFNVQKLEIFLK